MLNIFAIEYPDLENMQGFRHSFGTVARRRFEQVSHHRGIALVAERVFHCAVRLGCRPKHPARPADDAAAEAGAAHRRQRQDVRRVVDVQGDPLRLQDAADGGMCRAIGRRTHEDVRHVGDTRGVGLC